MSKRSVERLLVCGIVSLALLLAVGPLAVGAQGGWSAPENVSQSVANTDATSIVVDSRGRVHVAWSEGEAIWHRVRTGAAWSAPQNVATGILPELAADAEGRVYLVYSNQFEDNDEIYALIWEAATGWGLPTNVSSTTTSSLDPSAATTPGGQLAVVWSEEAGAIRRIYLAELTDGVLQSAGPIPDALGVDPVVAWKGANLAVAWQDVLFDPGLPMEIWASQRLGNTWSTPQDISGSADVESSFPAIAAYGGNVYLVWQEGVGSEAIIQFAHTIGGQWSWSVPESRSGAAPAYTPAVAFDVSGQGRLAWNTAGAIQQVRWNPATNTWLAIEDVATGLTNPSDVGLAATFATHLVWLALATPDNDDVWYSHTPIPILQPVLYLPLIRKA